MAGASAKNVDFSKVKDGGAFNRKRIPAGDYLATVTKVEDAEAKDGVFQYLVSIKINQKPSSVFPYYCKLTENQLWKLRNLLIAGGLNVPKKRVKVDPSKLIGRQIGVTVEDDEYDGKEQSTIAGVFPAAELADGNLVAEEDEVEADVDEDEDTDLDDIADEPEDEEDPLADLDRAALKAAIKAIQSDFVAKKSQSDDDLRDLLRSLQSAGDDEAEEDEEEEPEPAPKPAAKKKAAPKKKASEVTDEELEELDLDDL